MEKIKPFIFFVYIQQNKKHTPHKNQITLKSSQYIAQKKKCLQIPWKYYEEKVPWLVYNRIVDGFEYVG